MMSSDKEELYPWEQLKSSDVDIYRAFLKLCIVEDPIWDKISRKLEEPLRNTHVDERGDFATGIALGIRLIQNSTSRDGGNPDRSSGNTSEKF
ncbi:hypothetical protein Tco_0793913 [Tanacetum coccineum]